MGKLVKGRKRHLLADTLGLVLMVVVTGASVQDRDGTTILFTNVKHRCSRLQHIWANEAYAGTLRDWVNEQCAWGLEMVSRPPGTKGFEVLPRRWVVERTFGGVNSARRLSKEDEFLTAHSETMVSIAMIRLMVKRLA